MPPAAASALLIIDEDSLAHNRAFIARLRSLFALTVHVRRRAGLRLASRSRLALREAALFARLLASPWPYRRRSLILCSSGHYAALLAGRLSAALGNRTDIVLYNFYLHGLGERPAVRRLLRVLLSERVCVAAQSRRDLDYFAALGGSARLTLVPYRQDPVADVGPEDVVLSDYVFAGGYSNRDYDLLLRCARRLTEISFVLAVSNLNTLTEPVPANVVVHRDLEPAAFHRRLACARLVAIPLANDVGASGQMVCLAAMQLGKAVLVPDFDGLTQYVEDGATGLVYRGGDEAALHDAIERWFGETDAIERIGAAARERYLGHFTRRPFDDALIQEVERVAGIRPTPIPASS